MILYFIRIKTIFWAFILDAYQTKHYTLPVKTQVKIPPKKHPIQKNQKRHVISNVPFTISKNILMLYHSIPF
jgi:hypothetical protein